MAGARPVFADVDPATGNLTAAAVAPHVTARTRAIIPVHLYGLLCDMEALQALARARNLILIEDSAHCVEARRGPVRPGTHSDCACFSFYATKNLTCGEGGALATNDAALAERVRRLALHGMTTSAYERYASKYKHWDMPEWGWKYNLDNLRASLLTPQIRKLDELCRRRREIAAEYEAGFRSLPGLEFPRVEQPTWSARHLFPIWVPPQHRDAVIAGLQERGVGVGVNYRAVHLLDYYARTCGYRRGDRPAAEAIGDRTLSLPLYPKLTADEIQYVIAAVSATVGEFCACPC